MRQQSPAPTPGGGNIYISGRVEGKNFAIGPHARVNVVENHFYADIGEVRLRQVVARILQEGGTQANHLAALGVSSGVAPLVLRAEQLSPQEPFAPPIGIPPLPSYVQPSDLNRTSAGFAQISQLLGQIDQQIQGGKAQEVSAGGQSLNLGALLLQQGNLDLWRFRQGASRLFAEQASFYALSEPQSPAQPAVQAFQAAARSNVEVLRSWMLFQKYRTRQSALIDQTDWNALNQGRWQAVLDNWVATRRLSSEQAQAERLYLSALGEHYDSQAVQTAAREAEWSFSEVLRRQPDQSAALVNLAALLAESALLAYIETGVADRARLQQARNLFQQAHVLLDHRPDREGQIALAQCLLYEATSLPPDAHLEQVQWAIRQEQQMRATLGQNALGLLRLDIAERNLARRDPSFFDEKKIEQARDILIGAGAMAGLIVLAEQLLGTHTQMVEFLQAGWHAGAGHRLPMPHPGQSGGNAPGPTSSPHASVPGTHPAHGASTMQSAGKAAARGVRHKLLATMHGKIIAGVLATVVVLGASAAVLAVRAHQTPPAGPVVTTSPTSEPRSRCSTSSLGTKPDLGRPTEFAIYGARNCQLELSGIRCSKSQGGISMHMTSNDVIDHSFLYSMDILLGTAAPLNPDGTTYNGTPFNYRYTGPGTYTPPQVEITFDEFQLSSQTRSNQWELIYIADVAPNGRLDLASKGGTVIIDSSEKTGSVDATLVGGSGTIHITGHWTCP
jgi:hypothetical protein